jgi:hypothetical protein
MRNNVSPRAAWAGERLAAMRAAPPERIPQLYDSWLQLATPGEVRRFWRRWMGPCPGWVTRKR